MEFQVLSATLDDRYPRGLPPDVESRLDVLYEVPDDGPVVQKKTPGCVGFVFGRDAEGRSLCVRVEGVEPKLYAEFAYDGESIDAVRDDLEREVKAHLGAGRVRCTLRTFAHFYGYEPDASSASGRRVYKYVEAAYPTLRAWRAACQIRRRDEYHRFATKRAEALQEREGVRASLLELRQRAMQPSAADALADARLHTTLTTRAKMLDESTLPWLESKLSSLTGVDETPPARGPSRRVHEVFVDPLTRFFHETGLVPGAWTCVDARAATVRISTCDIEVDAAMNGFARVDYSLNAPYVSLYYDIETLGLDPRSAPVVQISAVVVRGAHVEKYLVALDDVAPLDGITVRSCSDEAGVLRTFRALVVEKDPDFLVAYNGVNFDNSFLAARAASVDLFWYLSRFATTPSRLRELQLNSSGMGDNKLSYFDLAGRATLDWYVKLKRDLTSEPSYKLSHFAAKFCGADAKDDVHYKEIPGLQKGTPVDRARLGKYCVQDSYLLHRLDEARTMTVEILQFAAVFCVLPEWVYFRGQQVRFVAQLLSKARVAETVPLLLNTPLEGFSGECEGGYEGATVNDPVRGFHERVAVLDWKALYPSVMMAHNFCHSTWVRDASLLDTSEGVVAHPISTATTYHFVTSATHKGILPRILEELLEQRASARKQGKVHAMRAKADNVSADEVARQTLMAKVFDGRQLALKVACNSVYGACGATMTGKYPCLAVSAAVTYQGRQAMVIKKEILPTRFPGMRILYGDTDSVMVAFPDATSVEETFARAEEASAFVTEHFATLGYPSMILEFEKVYDPYLLENKKRYMGVKYEPDAQGCVVCKGIDAKGVETERKDTLPFLKVVMCDVRDAVLRLRDMREALGRFDGHMARLVRDEVPWEQLTLRRNLSSKVVAKTDSIAWARVNALRASREAGSEAAVNEQVEYVIVNGPKDAKTTQLAEDPEYAKAHGLRLNRLWYFEHCIEDAMRRMFDVVEGLDAQQVFDRVRQELNRERLGVRSLAVMDAAAGASVNVPRIRMHVPAPPPPRKRRK